MMKEKFRKKIKNAENSSKFKASFYSCYFLLFIGVMLCFFLLECSSSANDETNGTSDENAKQRVEIPDPTPDPTP